MAADRHVEGVVEMMLDATQRLRQPLTEERLFGWHASLFLTAAAGSIQITLGWVADRTAPMRVVSGPVGRERGTSKHLRRRGWIGDVALFFEWSNGDAAAEPGPKAAQAHRGSEIHPFDDGNGRIARAIADMALAASKRAANGAQHVGPRSGGSGRHDTGSSSRQRNRRWTSCRGGSGSSGRLGGGL